ncbi:juvenile hormone acid O-methyltransferase [Neodiprion lecontei]|uniref:Juvenile hormone acid O-methyltransferase n=1 Tax=Neodiprion lecontei TaxID=441921 RepID=A0A6J0BQQ8_NEOLC|nr:juvenile hormone acid O-methyltransferase [Neodiprion lecontei]
MDRPELYIKANLSQRNDASNITAEFREELKQMSGRCLDIGSGPGDVVMDFILPRINPNATIVCSDISEAMVKYGTDKYGGNNRMTYIKLDIETPNLPSNLVQQFNHITSFYCLHWCQNMRKVFENIFNLLRPGGTCLLLFVANDASTNAYKTLAAMPRYKPYMTDADSYIPFYQHPDRQDKTPKILLQEIGFEVCHCSRRQKSYVFDKPEALSDFVLSGNPFVERMPMHLRDDYKKDLVKEVAKHQIIFSQDPNNRDLYSVLYIYYLFVVYMKKPF